MSQNKKKGRFCAAKVPLVDRVVDIFRGCFLEALGRKEYGGFFGRLLVDMGRRGAKKAPERGAFRGWWMAGVQ